MRTGMLLNLVLFATFAWVGASMAAAGANANTSDRLAREAQELERQIQWSNLDYTIRDGVANFSRAANTFAICERELMLPGYPRNGYRSCDMERAQVFNSFERIDNYLAGTANYAPNVFQAFQRVQMIMRELRYDNGGGAIPGRQLRATGVMDTARFRFMGFNHQEIYRECMNFGYNYRLTLVRNLVVNGQRFGGGYNSMTLTQACDIVSNYAR